MIEVSARGELYRDTAEFLDIRYEQKDYASEAGTVQQLFDSIHPGAVSLLDVACGTGKHLAHLGQRYRAEGLDLSPELLRLAQNRLPGIPLHQGDMTDFRLGRTFDLVTCLFASIAMFSSPERMRASIRRMSEHLATDGVLFIEPYLTPGVYRKGEVVHNFRQTPERKLSWMYVMRYEAGVASWDIHWLIGTHDDEVVHFVEHEEYSLFTTGEIVEALRDCGLQVLHHARGLHGYGALIARRQPWSDDEIGRVNSILSA